jgi:hypothetical protein
VIPLLVAHFMRYGRSGFKERNLYLALVLSGLTFLMTTPFAILDFPKFFTDLQFDRQHYSTGHAGMEGDTLLWYLAYLWKTTGPIFLVAFIAILYGIATRSREIVILSAFPLVYFVFISRFVVRNDRTLLPLTPFLFLLASALLVLLVERAIKLRSRPWMVTSILLLSAVAITGLGISARKTASLGVQLNTVTSRETARVWIEDNLPPGARIAIEAYAPFVDPDRFSVQGFTQMIDHEPVWYRDQGFQYLVFGQGMYGRFFADPGRYADEVSQYSEFFVQFHLVREFSDGDYEVRIYRIPER